jgi:hypothetical protein
VHGLHGLRDHFTGHLFAVPGDDGSDGASGRNAYLTFSFHSDSFLSESKKKGAHCRTECTCAVMNAFAHLQVL